MRRAITSLWRTERHDEGGFTLVELLVTMSIMSIVATAVMTVSIQTVRTTNTVTDRRDVFNDGRFALDQLSTQIRQGESIATTSTAQLLRLSGYIDGTAKTIVWRTTGSSAPYSLEHSTDGGATYVTMASSLASKDIFTYTAHDGTNDQVTVDMELMTSTSSVDLTTDIYLRNVG